MKTIGAIAPSSIHLAERMIAPIDFSIDSVTILEYGPGTGSFTKTILSRLSPNGRLIAIEMNEDLASHLREQFPDPRLQVIVGNASDARVEIAKLGITSIDYVISSLPLGNIPSEKIGEIMNGIHDCLSETGLYIQFQYVPWRLGNIKKFFNIKKISFEPRNIPPAFVIVSEKKI
jgi:phospholipid N-methyltransferase